MSFGVLIAGLGKIGAEYDRGLDSTQVHSHARAFALHSAFQLQGGVDPAPERRRIFTEEYGCPAFADIEAALAQFRPDVVVIATPTEMHGDTLQQVLRHSAPRAILCEKPLSYDPGEARGMVHACAERGVKLWVNYMRRSDGGVIEIRRRIVTGELGSGFKGVLWYSKGFLHNGSHFFNLLQYWLGPVAGFRDVLRGRDLGNGDCEMDVHVSFERGSVVFLAMPDDALSRHTLELASPTGRLLYDFGGRVIEWQPAASGSRLEGEATPAQRTELIPSGMDKYQWHVTDALARSFAGHDAPLCSGAEALETLESMQLILRQP